MTRPKHPAAVALGKLGGAVTGPSKRRSTSFSAADNPKQAATHAVKLQDGSYLELHVQAYVAAYEDELPVVRSTSPAATHWLRRRGWIKAMRVFPEQGRMFQSWTKKTDET